MIIKTQGLIIKEQAVGESDRLVTILTADHGVIRAFAKRAKSLRDSKNSSTALLAYSKFSIYKTKDSYIVDSASSIEIFFDLRLKIENLSLAQYFCELAYLFVPEETDSGEFLRLVLNSLNFLCKATKDQLLVKAITELRMASLAGYMPNLVACSECACYENELWYFFPKKGEIVCQNCLKDSSIGAFQINQSILTAMRHIVFSDFSKIYSFNMPKEAINILTKITEVYTLNILGKSPMTLDFFKTINEDFYE